MRASRATLELLRTSLTTIAIISLCGCGQKGPLILPADPASPSVATPQQNDNSDEQESEAEDES